MQYDCAIDSSAYWHVGDSLQIDGLCGIAGLFESLPICGIDLGLLSFCRSRQNFASRSRQTTFTATDTN